MKMSSMKATVLVLATFLLVSCGGGGGGGVLPFPSPFTGGEPTVTAKAPVSGASGVNVGTSITATFSEAMDDMTISGATFYLRKSGFISNITATVTYSAASLTATLTPLQSLTSNTTYVVTITTGVKDSGGTSLAGSVTWSFTTSAAATYSIGGTITNLNGTVVLRNNGANDLTIARTEGGGNTYNGPFVFTNKISSGANYSVTVLTQPTNTYQFCTVTNGSGTLGSADVTNVAIDCVNTTGPRYSAARDWNDYVRNDGTTRFNALNTACTGAETGGYRACIHGGEVREVEATDKTLCTGLTASDSLGAFDWECVSASPYVKMVSRALKREKLLSDLIDFAPETPVWRENAVTVLDGAATLLTTPFGTWWNNPIVVNNTGATLSAAGTIYVVTAQPSPAAPYTFGASRTGLVVKPGLALQGVLNTDMVTAGPLKFLWIEGTLKGPGGAGVLLNGTRFSVIRGLKAGAVGDAISLTGTVQEAANNLIMNVRTGDAATGIRIYNSSNNTVSGAVLTNNYRGMDIFSAPNNVFENVTVANSAVGGVSSGYPTSKNNIFLNATVTNSSPGLYFSSTGNNNLVVNTAAVNNYDTGIYFGISASNNTFLNIASAHNAYPNYSGKCSAYQIMLVGDNNTVTGLLKIGTGAGTCTSYEYSSSTACYGNGTNPGLMTDTCANNGNSNATLTTGVTVASVFVGKVTTDDTVNASDTNGAATYDRNSLDWLFFDDPYRGWGMDRGAFPDVTNYDRCSSITPGTTDTCRIWDWSLLSSDTVLRGVLSTPTGSDTLTHVWSAATQSECSAIAGAAWIGASSTCSSTFLRNAVEIIGDGIGNENGLCESGETCLVTPNIGSYQGHGALVSAGPFTDGTLTGITLLKYSTNGY